MGIRWRLAGGKGEEDMLSRLPLFTALDEVVNFSERKCGIGSVVSADGGLRGSLFVLGQC